MSVNNGFAVWCIDQGILKVAGDSIVLNQVTRYSIYRSEALDAECIHLYFKGGGEGFLIDFPFRERGFPTKAHEIVEALDKYFKAKRGKS